MRTIYPDIDLRRWETEDGMIIADADNYYTKRQVDELIAGGLDPEDFYDKTEVDILLADKLDASAYTPTDLSNYYTKNETSGATEISTALSQKASVEEFASVLRYMDNNFYPKTQTSGKTEIQNALDEKASQEVVAGAIQAMATALSSDIINVDNSLKTHTADTTVHVTASDKAYWTQKADASALNNYYTKTEVDTKETAINNNFSNYLLKSKIWCGTEQEFARITTKDPETLYLIHS